MARELLLLRHGKPDRKGDTDDYNRPLKNKGKRGAQRIGAWLLQQNLKPDLIITSPAERALATAHKCCKAMGMDARNVQQDKRIYQADVDDLIKVLTDSPKASQRVMLVGHNPALEQLVRLLSDELPEVPSGKKLMPTATLARLQLPGDWSDLKKHQAKLLQLTRASSLPKLFPFPTPDGMEQRDRPIYYYTQSSVVPYRINDNQIEVMITRSSQKKHWVVPKGIADPGYTLQESACKEALEEAGVIGKVTEDALGTYTVPKWGATCTVTVYPMLVQRQLPDDEWEESHRGREWVSPEEATALLKQAELGPMIRALEKRLISG